MGKVTLQPGQNIAAYNHSLGRTGFSYYFDEATLEIEIPEVDQATMDAGLVAYTANQAADDAAYGQFVADAKADRERGEFDDDEIATAIIKEMVDQLNDIRAQTGQAALNFGLVNAAIRQRIG